MKDPKAIVGPDGLVAAGIAAGQEYLKLVSEPSLSGPEAFKEMLENDPWERIALAVLSAVDIKVADELVEGKYNGWLKEVRWKGGHRQVGALLSCSPTYGAYYTGGGAYYMGGERVAIYVRRVKEDSDDT